MKSFWRGQRDAVILVALALLMLVSRYHHFGTRFSLPDASFAIFFLAGLYLRRPVFFVSLAVEAVVIDYVTITYLGVSNWCWTPAYAGLAISYLALWGGGFFCHRLRSNASGGLALYGLVAFASASAAYLISDGAFYWLSGRITAPNLSGYWLHMTKYYVSYVSVACAYIAAIEIARGAVAFVKPQTGQHSA